MLTSIDVYYGSVQALKGVSLEVNEGEITSLIGSNGAGKEYALEDHIRTPSNRLPEHLLHGAQDRRSSPREYRKPGIAHVPEGRMIFPAFSVLDNPG